MACLPGSKAGDEQDDRLRDRPHVDSRRIEGKVAIVTGAGSDDHGPGVGSAIAEILAAAGARLCVLDVIEARAARTCAAIIEAGGDAFGWTGDITNERTCVAAVSATISRYGRTDILVNNVGIAEKAELAELTPEKWSRIFDANAMGAMLMSKHAVPATTANGGGAIVNISSIGGLRAHGNLTYAASKAALTALGENIAVTHGRRGVRVNTIAPGYLRTPIAIRENPASRRLRREITPLGIEGDAWDVALATLFPASDEARFINCAMLTVDGGACSIGAVTAFAFGSAQGIA